jgi:hypothetical protein
MVQRLRRRRVRLLPEAPGAAVDAARELNTAILLDTDSVFTASIASAIDAPLPPIAPGMRLVFDGAERWTLRNGDAVSPRTVGRAALLDLVEGYCFADEAERRAWRSTATTSPRRASSTASPTTCAPAVASPPTAPRPTDLALVIIDEYIKFQRRRHRIGSIA